MPVRQLRRIRPESPAENSINVGRGRATVRHAHSALSAQHALLAASSLLRPRAVGCIYRGISGLPLAQWAPLVLGLSLSRQASKRLSKQLSLSAAVTGRATNCMGTEMGGVAGGGKWWANEIADLMTR